MLSYFDGVFIDNIMGKIAMEMLVNQFKNTKKAKDNTVNRVTLIPRLILRGSEKLMRKE